MYRLQRHFGLLGSIWLVMVLCAPASGEGPDVLYFKSGSRLTGTSLGLADGRLRWEMPHGSLIAVPLEEIDRIEYRSPASVLEAPADPAILGLRPPGDERYSELAGSAPDDDGYQFFDSLGERVSQGAQAWTKRLEFGGRFLDGNSDEDFLNVIGKFERDEETRFSQLDLGGQYGSANGDKTTNRWYGNATIDFRKDDKWIVFVTSKNEFDEFENLDYRGTFSGGLGYRFYNEKLRRLILRVGPGFTYEKFHAPKKSRSTPDLFGEVEFRWPLFDRTEIEHKTTVNPSLENFDVFRLISTYGLLIRLDDSQTWSMKVGLRHEYNSMPNEDREPDDFTTSILLVYRRK